MNHESFSRRRFLIAAGMAGAAMGWLPPEAAAGAWPAGMGQLSEVWEVLLHWNGLNPVNVIWTLNGNGTFSSSDGYSGTWVNSGGLVLLAVHGGSRPAFAGNLSGLTIPWGIALQPNGGRGSWSARQRY